MQLVQLDRIAVQHAGRTIFRDLQWSVNAGERVGLVGPNGSGKSSLLRAVAGDLPVDAGRVLRPRELRIGRLEQEVRLPEGRSLLETAAAPPPRLAAVEADLARVERELADPEVSGDERRLVRALERQQRALERYEAAGGPQHESRVRQVLDQLGLERDQWELPVEALSGGQRKLVGLARLVLDAPDLLLLDEPDNHLDLAAKARLEAFARGYDGAIVIVSHDRYLLDGAVDAIAELSDGKLELYSGNYSAYATERELRRLRQQKRWADQQKEVARIEAAIARFELWASMVVNERHIKQARSRRKMLDRMEASPDWAERVREHRPMKLRLEGGRGSTRALELESVSIGFGGKPLLEGVDLLVTDGERVGLVGPNGSGKSVLLKLVLGEIAPDAGRIRTGPSTRVGYYAQEHQTLEAWLERPALELVRDRATLTEGAAVSFLTRFQLDYDQVRSPVRTLSGGERSRLQLALLMLDGPNLLLLDEPTNNLDIPSAEVLEAALDDFQGSVLLVSHDRYLLDRTVDRVVAIEGDRLASYLGGYTDYLDEVSERHR